MDQINRQVEEQIYKRVSCWLNKFYIKKHPDKIIPKILTIFSFYCCIQVLSISSGQFLFTYFNVLN